MQVTLNRKSHCCEFIQDRYVFMSTYRSPNNLSKSPLYRIYLLQVYEPIATFLINGLQIWTTLSRGRTIGGCLMQHLTEGTTVVNLRQVCVYLYQYIGLNDPSTQFFPQYQTSYGKTDCVHPMYILFSVFVPCSSILY